MISDKLYMGWVSHAWRKEDSLKQIIKLQNGFIVTLLVICLGLFAGWMRSPSQLTVHIPPDIQNGATIKAGMIPSPLVYSFTYEVWQQINYWPKDGEEDYKKNIQDYWSYLTPKFKRELLQEYDELKTNGQLQRVRYLQGLSGSAYDAVNVKKLDADTWEVDLKMQLTELKNNQPVKEVEIVYPIRVTRTNISARNNPYGLVIAGFASSPQRTSTHI